MNKKTRKIKNKNIKNKNKKYKKNKYKYRTKKKEKKKEKIYKTNWWNEFFVSKYLFKRRNRKKI